MAVSTQHARVVELVETATGQRYSVRRERGPASSFGRRFTVIFDETAAELAAQLSGNAARVLLALPSQLDFRGFKPLHQADLAARVGLSQSAVSRALRELEDAKVVEAKGKATAITWRLCRRIGYRGTAAQFHAEERAERVSQQREQHQPGLQLGPLRVVRGGKKSAPKAAVSRA